MRMQVESKPVSMRPPRPGQCPTYMPIKRGDTEDRRKTTGSERITYAFAHAFAKSYASSAGRFGGNVTRLFCRIVDSMPVIYSYGSHYIVALRCPYAKSPTGFAFLINGDRSSPTTNKHIFDVRRALSNPYINPHTTAPIFTVSFSALFQAIGNLESGTVSRTILDTDGNRTLLHALSSGAVSLLDARADEYAKSGTAPSYFSGSILDAEPSPLDGWTIDHTKETEDTPAYWTAHRPALALFRLTVNTTLDYRLLMGMDEGSYYISQMKGKPTTCQAALNSFMPASVRGKTFERQGEWYFTPLLVTEGPCRPPNLNTPAKIDRWARQNKLVRCDALPRPGSKPRALLDGTPTGYGPNDGGTGNLHKATRIYTNRAGTTLYVFGIVRHDSRVGRRGRPQHRNLDLRAHGLCTAIRNTSPASWSSTATGGVD